MGYVANISDNHDTPSSIGPPQIANYNITMAADDTMNDQEISPPTADGPTDVTKVSRDDAPTQEVNDVTTEFNRSLSISNNNDAQTQTDSQPPPDSKEESKADRRYLAPKDFELLKVIGMGAFGKVLQVRNRLSSKIYAMKVISKRLLKRRGSYVENILAERDILSKIANYPFIVTMHASFQTREKLFIIMDFCAGGELFLKVAREGHFRERTAAFYLAEITLALEHLHSVNVLHRDLKPENILLGSDGHCCLTDFGLAKDFTGMGDSDEDGRARTLCGTMEYMAPEMVARKWYGKGADFWSLGCIAYEMLSGLPPFSSKKGSKELFKKIMNERIRMPDGASAEACKLLKGLLNRNPNQRLGAMKGTMFEVGGTGALKQQPFFLGLDWGKLELKEIDPPEDFSVDNDEDLRHFHDEFVKMALPRSVKEMSKLDFLPKHCESDNFRGFSFIGDAFPLPERTASEQEHYWNNVEEDGQSLSECASSVFDGDLGETAEPEPLPSEKKKRPPRKKKKKQQQVPPLETTKEGTEGSENGISVEQDKKNPQTSDGGEPDAAPSDVRMQSPKPSDAKPSNESQNKPQSVDISANTPPMSLNPNAKAWTVSPPTKVAAPQASLPTPQATKVQEKPVVAKSYTPKPGTWASMAVGKAKADTSQRQPTTPINNRPTITAAVASPTMAFPQSPPTNSSSPDSDWRTHVISPQRNKKVLSKSIPTQNLPPPAPAWPALGDFPPPPGAKLKDKKPNKPMGAWGKAG